MLHQEAETKGWQGRGEKGEMPLVGQVAISLP